MSAGRRRALVTGGAGFIGSHLAERLVREGWEVRVLDDFSTGREENLADVRGRIELLRGDLRDRALVARGVAGAELVFHHAAIPSVPRSVEDPLRSDAVNVHGTLGLLESARAAGVRRVVFAASCAAYGDGGDLPKREDAAVRPASPYALQKYVGERYCRLYSELFGFPTVALRYFNVFGPRQNPDGDYAAAIPRFIRACLRGEPPRIFGDGAQTRDFVYVDDVIGANLLAAEAEPAVGSVVNVASGVETSVNELVEAVRGLTGFAGQAVYAPRRVGDVERSVADIGAARALLGWAPTVSLREGLRRTIASFRAAGGMAA